MKRWRRFRQKAFWPALIVALNGVIIGIVACQSIAPSNGDFSQERLWREIQPLAREYRFDPGFIWAIAFAESTFNPDASNGEATGLFQIRPIAWKEVREDSFGNARDWRKNLAAAVAYMDYCRRFLERHDRFSYPLMAASYRYGIGTVQRAGFRIENLPTPRNATYRRIFAGDINPVPPPGEV